MGAVVFSIDAELAWGFHDQRTLPMDRLTQVRSAWHSLLELLDRYDLSATWAVVGHLMLDRCDGQHRTHPTPPGWFARDPGGETQIGSLWFGPDLVRAIQESSVEHELASHTFSHLPLGGSEITAEMVDAELSTHKEIADEWGVSLETLVFPRNDVAFRERLRPNGFTCYRGRSPSRWYDKRPGRRLGKAADLLLRRSTPPLVTPSVGAGNVVNIPASMDLFGFEGSARRLVEPVAGDPIVDAARRGITAASDGPGIFHGWLHPNNITTKADIDRLASVFRIASQADVPVRTMGSVARQVREG